jgi:hypothetical protein
VAAKDAAALGNTSTGADRVKCGRRACTETKSESPSRTAPLRCAASDHRPRRSGDDAGTLLDDAIEPSLRTSSSTGTADSCATTTKSEFAEFDAVDIESEMESEIGTLERDAMRKSQCFSRFLFGISARQKNMTK